MVAIAAAMFWLDPILALTALAPYCSDTGDVDLPPFEARLLREARLEVVDERCASGKGLRYAGSAVARSTKQEAAGATRATSELPRHPRAGAKIPCCLFSVLTFCAEAAYAAIILLIGATRVAEG